MLDRVAYCIASGLTVWPLFAIAVFGVMLRPKGVYVLAGVGIVGWIASRFFRDPDPLLARWMLDCFALAILALVSLFRWTDLVDNPPAVWLGISLGVTLVSVVGMGSITYRGSKPRRRRA